jgi:hypothetical protein
MSNPQLFVHQRYLQDRLNSTSSINSQGSDGGYDVDIGALASFFNSIGLRKLPDDFSTAIEIFFGSSFAKIFTFGLNTFPNADWKSLVGSMQELGALNIANPANLGIGDYIHLKSGLYNNQRR